MDLFQFSIPFLLDHVVDVMNQLLLKNSLIKKEGIKAVQKAPEHMVEKVIKKIEEEEDYNHKGNE